MKPNNDSLFIDLSDITMEEITVLSEEGGRGVPEFAASSCDGCTCEVGGCSCTQAP